jgi:hypothetical protein
MITPVGGPDVHRLLVLSAPLHSSQIKKKSRIRSTTGSAVAPTHFPLYRASRRPSSPLSPCLHRRGVLTAQGCTTRLLLSPPPRACAQSSGSHSRPSTAILLHRNRAAGIPLCRAPPTLTVIVCWKAHVIAYVSEVCCKCFRWMLQK